MQRLCDIWESRQDGPIFRDQEHAQLLRCGHDLTLVGRKNRFSLPGADFGCPQFQEVPSP
jgi:hypothetical protein